MDKIRVLIVDNEPGWQKIWREELGRHGEFSVDTTSTFLEATSLIANNTYEGAIIDKGGKDLIEKPSPTYDYHDGLRLIKQIKQEQPFCRIVLNTGESFSRSVFDCGASVFLDKGLTAEYSEKIVELLSHGALRENEMNQPILNLSGKEFRRPGPERW